MNRLTKTSVFLVLIALALATPVQAQVAHTWNDVAGSFDDPLNWDPNGFVALDTFTIARGTTNFPTLSTDLNATQLGGIQIGYGAVAGQLDITSTGKLNTTGFTVGHNGSNGTMNTAGDITGAAITIGYTSSTSSGTVASTGVYNQTAGNATFATATVTRRKGVGTLNLQGGTFTITDNIQLGTAAASGADNWAYVNIGADTTFNAKKYYSLNRGITKMTGGELNVTDIRIARYNGYSNGYSYLKMTNGAAINSVDDGSYQVFWLGDNDNDGGYRRGAMYMSGDDTVVNWNGGSGGSEFIFGLWSGRGYLYMGAELADDNTTVTWTNTSPEVNISNNYVALGYSGYSSSRRGTGVVDMRGKSVMNISNSQIHAGIWEWGYGEINVKENAALNVSGGFLMLGDDWAFRDAAAPGIAEGILSVDDNAVINLTHGASLRLGNLGLGKGTVNMGQVGDGADANAQINLVGEYDGGQLYLSTGGTAIFNQNAGTTTVGGGTLFSWQATTTSDHDVTISVNNSATLNLNGGTFATTFINTEDVSVQATVNLNGGVLKAAGSSTKFIANDAVAPMHVYVTANGAIIDTNGFGSVISQPLESDAVSLGGGLTKNGAGTLVLSAVNPNTYTGPTTVNAGTLALVAYDPLVTSSGVIVNSGANLEFPLMGNGIPALQLNDGARLSLSVSSYEDPTALYVTGALDAGGAGTKTIALNPKPNDSFNTATPYKISAGSVSAVGLTAVSNVRAFNAVATVVGNEVEIQLSDSGNAAKNLTYVAGSNNVWDINTTANWTDGSTPEKFYHWDGVTLPASMGNINIAIEGAVMPSEIAVETSAGDTYTLGGSGTISNAAGFATSITKNGDGTLVLDNAGVLNTLVNVSQGTVTTIGNDFNGSVNVNAGTLKIGSNAGPNPLGTTSGETFVAVGATLDVNGKNLGNETVEIGGAGVNGNGAIISSSTNTQYNALKNVVVTTDNITFGGNAGRWDIRDGSLTGLVPYTLTKIGTSTVDICNDAVDNNLGDINVLGGVLYFEGEFTGWGDSSKTITIGPEGTLDLYYTTWNIYNHLTKNVVVNGGTFRSTGYNTIHGSITLNENAKFISTDYGVEMGTWGHAIDLTLNSNATFTMETGWIGGGFDGGGTATITLNDTSILKANQWANIGERFAVAQVFLHDTAQLTAVDHFDIGYGESTNSTLVADGSSVFHSDLNLFIGVYGANARGTVRMNETSTISAAQDVYVGRDNYDAVNLTSGLGTLELNNHATAAVGRDLIIGYGFLTNGTVDLNADTVTTVTRNLRVGRWGGNGILNVRDNAQVTAGTIEVGHNWGNTKDELGDARVVVSGANSQVSSTGWLILGGDAGKGTWTQDAGHTTAGLGVVLGEGDYSDSLADYPASYSVAELSLNGGTLTTPMVVTHAKVISTHADDTGAERINPVTATVNFNGGLLQASADNANFMAIDDPAATLTLKVQAGGAIIDSNGKSIGSALALVHDGAGTDGGLTKIGDGQLSLTGALSYNGPTTVNQGTLTVAALTASPQIYVADPATLNAGSIVADTLTIGGPQISVAAAAAAVPEPGTFVLLALAGLALVGAYLRRQ